MLTSPILESSISKLKCVHTYVMAHMYCRFLKTKNPATLVALIPLSFIMGYQLDMAFGNKMERIAGKFLLETCA